MSDTRIKRLLSTDELLPFTRCSPSSNVAHAFGLVKREPRRGWLDFGVERPESVADHMHRMALLTFNLPDQVEMIATPGELVPINLDRCVRMCLVHDLAEGLTGDLTPRDNVTKTDKQKLEQEGMATTTADMDSQRRQGLMAVWQEYEDRSTAEAIVVKDLDMYEMCVQAREYEQHQAHLYKGSLQAFFDSVKGKFKTRNIQDWHDALVADREYDP